jgi:hypothetical protein
MPMGLPLRLRVMRSARSHRAQPGWRWRVPGLQRQRLSLLSCHDPNNRIGQRTDADTQCQHGNRAEGDKVDAGYRLSRLKFFLHFGLTLCAALRQLGDVCSAILQLERVPCYAMCRSTITPATTKKATHWLQNTKCGDGFFRDQLFGRVLIGGLLNLSILCAACERFIDSTRERFGCSTRKFLSEVSEFFTLLGHQLKPPPRMFCPNRR